MLIDITNPQALAEHVDYLQREKDRLAVANQAMKEALAVAATIQHETSRDRGEVDCTKSSPCLFCSALTLAEGKE